MNQNKVEDFLKTFPAKHVASLIRHFTAAVGDFQQGNWEDSIAKAGKFVEAVLKSLWVLVGNTVPSGRAFKVDPIINGLGGLAAGSHHDSVRLLIPRACRFAYDIASNRGGRHDPDEVDPNEIDATVVLASSSWILAEMIRSSQTGNIDLSEVKELVDSLVEKRYPLVERVEGRVYFHGTGKSAPDVMLLTLADEYPGRVTEQDLLATAQRHRFTPKNARVALERVMKFVDNDGSGRLRLLAPGLKKAEEIRTRIQSEASGPRRRRRRARR